MNTIEEGRALKRNLPVSQNILLLQQESVVENNDHEHFDGSGDSNLSCLRLNDVVRRVSLNAPYGLKEYLSRIVNEILEAERGEFKRIYEGEKLINAQRKYLIFLERTENELRELERLFEEKKSQKAPYLDYFDSCFCHRSLVAEEDIEAIKSEVPKDEIQRFHVASVTPLVLHKDHYWGNEGYLLIAHLALHYLVFLEGAEGHRPRLFEAFGADWPVRSYTFEGSEQEAKDRLWGHIQDFCNQLTADEQVKFFVELGIAKKNMLDLLREKL